MRNATAAVNNIQVLTQAWKALHDRGPGVPGIGLIWGPTGYGKTTATAWLAVQRHAIHVRAVATWTPSSMLGALMRELDAQPMTRSADMLEFITKELTTQPRAIFVDEADYLMNKKLVETLRDLHDLSSVPLFLIGMADFKRKVIHREQLAGRIAQWVEFKPATLEDARKLATEVCEVEVTDDLLAHLHHCTGGSMRGMVVGLTKIEALGRRKGGRVSMKEWGSRAFTLTHEDAGE